MVVAGDVFYCLDNDKKRAFIPSIDNSFGGHICKYVMLDTGCNSHLLNIEDKGLPVLYCLFPSMIPNSAGDQFTYKIRKGGGVTSLQAPVLTISNNNGDNFKFVLSGDLHRFEFTHNACLRFSVCYEDAVQLLADHTAKIIQLVGSNELALYINAITQLRATLPGIALRGRYRHALLGRSVIGANGIKLLFISGITIVSANNARLTTDMGEINRLSDECENAVKASLPGGLDFWNDLEDDYMVEGPSVYGTEHRLEK